MDTKEIILAMWNKWQEWDGEELDRYFSKKDQKLVFLSEQILGLTTYDSGLDLELGKMVFEAMKQIQNMTTFDFIKDETNYRNYIISVNLIYDWLEWGTSIRGAWFNEYGGKIKPDEAMLSNVGHDKDYLSITKGFMPWFIDFLGK